MRILKGAKRTINKVDLLIKINKLKKVKNNEKIIYLLSPEHGNMGDQAIAIAIKNIFKKILMIKLS